MPMPGIVLLHVSDAAADLQRALGSARTLTADDPSVHVRVIVNGPALSGVTNGADAVTAPPRTTIEACQVGMRARGIRSDELQESVVTTPSAVVALARAQGEGAAYIRV